MVNFQVNTLYSRKQGQPVMGRESSGKRNRKGTYPSEAQIGLGLLWVLNENQGKAFF